MNETSPRRIWLCADDYGIAPGVNAAIRELVAQGRLNATSVMTVAPAFNADEVSALKKAGADHPRIAIGLHLTLTAPFKASVNGFRPLREGSFSPVTTTLKHAMLQRFDHAALRAEIEAQIAGFTHAFGAPPAFVDGHQHVHLFPQIRNVVLQTVQEAAPAAWVRQCGWPGRSPSLRDPKGLLIGWFSRDLRREARARGLQVNPAFAGTYTYSDTADFGTLFPGFVQSMPEGGLVMCHPGKVDDTLRRLDPLTDTREREYAYLSGAAFPRALAEAGVTLA